jgi:L-threonylcarbamoyladenylate synthase
VAFPTDTFFALSCDPFDAQALSLLRRLKGIGHDRPLPLLIPAIFDVSTLGCEFNGLASELAERFWPGKLTLIVPCKGALAEAVGRPNDGAIGLRIPAGAWLQHLLSSWSGPLVGTSANPTGRPPAVSPAQIHDYFGRQLGWASDQSAPGGEPSTVVDVTSGEIHIEREGAVPVSDLASLPRGSK